MGYGHPWAILRPFAAISCFARLSYCSVRYTSGFLIVFHVFSICLFDTIQSIP